MKREARVAWDSGEEAGVAWIVVIVEASFDARVGMLPNFVSSILKSFDMAVLRANDVLMLFGRDEICGRKERGTGVGQPMEKGHNSLSSGTGLGWGRDRERIWG